MIKLTVILALCLGAAMGKEEHVRYKPQKYKYSKSPASYGSNYADRSNYNDPYAPSFPVFSPQPFIDPYQFNNQLNAYIQRQQYQQNR